MTSACNDRHDAEHVPRGPDQRLPGPRKRTAAMTGALALTVLVAGCGSSNAPSSVSALSGGPQAKALAYTRCMRNHGVQAFPDPTTPPGGGATFQINLNQNTPTFKAASQACRTLLPGGQQAPTMSAQQIAAEVKWAQCLRSHGVPGFPDPNSEGAIDSAKFDPTSPAFQKASAACTSLQPSGPVSAVPGAP
jgi:hypothetical protein